TIRPPTRFTLEHCSTIRSGIRGGLPRARLHRCRGPLVPVRPVPYAAASSYDHPTGPTANAVSGTRAVPMSSVWSALHALRLRADDPVGIDRKSTRLNSSHVSI